MVLRGAHVTPAGYGIVNSHQLLVAIQGSENRFPSHTITVPIRFASILVHFLLRAFGIDSELPATYS